jgi:hypothetical protein
MRRGNGHIIGETIVKNLQKSKELLELLKEVCTT